MNRIQEFIDQGTWDFVRRADNILKASEGQETMFHGLRIMLEPILEGLKSIRNGQGDTTLLDWQDEVEACQARMGSVLQVLEFFEAHFIQQNIEDQVLFVFLGAHDLLKLAKVVIDTQVDELYSRPAPDEKKPVQASAPTPTTTRARRQEFAHG